MRRITLQEYNAIHPDFRGVWTTERTDWPDWEDQRESLMGKRTLMSDDGKCSLLIEGVGFVILEWSAVLNDENGTVIIEVFETTAANAIRKLIRDCLANYTPDSNFFVMCASVLNRIEICDGLQVEEFKRCMWATISEANPEQRFTVIVARNA